ncbi:YciI family protein [Caballeronia sp. CLC5]|uniref:YciI family protein n=1 Tax=Caballeronia sp. CLC5 TaxID=2906764 RepID=UPI001F210F51|nr:YciI family protein [Caballeronia sp. CLC5]MCE4573451.1 YciI family protein [Caballeronia sp. CLC5]
MFAADRPGARALRTRTKSRHSAHLDAGAPGVRVLQSGPWLDANGAEAGSLLILEAVTLQAAQSFLEADPYARAGLFERVDIKPWRWRRGNPFLPGDTSARAQPSDHEQRT